MKAKEIENLNNEILKCRGCRLWKTASNRILGEGNLNSRVMLIAQAPGIVENENGKMFLGPSGKVLDELLKKAGVKRNEIYMTNLIKCMLPKYRKPKNDEIKECSRFLDMEIEIVNPEILVPLGFYATKYLFEKYKINIHDKKDLRSVYGKLFLADRKIFPLHHPASVLYDESIKSIMMINYSKLKIFLKECKWFPVCPMHYFYEEGKLDRKWIELYCKGDWKSCKRYQMEERGEYHPDWMLPDGSIDEKLKRY